MKKIITLFIAGILYSTVASTTYAQTGSATISTTNLTPQIKAIIEDVKNQCQLNPTQTTKFTNDYVGFLNDNAKNISVNAGNQQKINSQTQALLLQVGTRFRGYLNDGQFSKLTKMIQAGKLNPEGTASVSQPTTTTTTTAPVKTLPPVGTGIVSLAALPSAVSSQSNVTSLFQQLSAAGYISVTPEQTAKVIPVLQGYDKNVTEIKTRDFGNNGKTQSELATLNTKTIDMLKPMLNSDQFGKLIVAATMQENILSGKNLSQDQKAFLDKLRNQYSLSDVQLMSVVLVMVQGKIRGDAINQMAKTNPQGAAQELGKLLQDLDGQLKSSLSSDQYTKVKSDIEKLLKGQKI